MAFGPGATLNFLRKQLSKVFLTIAQKHSQQGLPKMKEG